MKRRIFLKSATRAVAQVSASTGVTVGATVALTSVTACADTPSRSVKTSRDAEGPFYPVVPIPLDNNLLLNNRFIGEELLFSGRVLDTASNPVNNIRVEIWQCDGNSMYRHPKAPPIASEDLAFRGFGATMNNDQGNFDFITIVPVPYPGRPPHIHVKLKRSDKTILTTQIYLQGFSGPDERKLTTSKVSDIYEASFNFII